MMLVFPVDLNAFGLGNRDVLGLVGRVTHWVRYSLIDSFDVAHASDPADGGDHALQLFLVVDL